MNNNFYIYLSIACLVTFIIRALPLTILRKQITNKYIKSFLYYVPYVTLATMTFPAIIQITTLPIYGYIALIIGIITAYKDFGLFKVTGICCLCVFVLEVFF